MARHSFPEWGSGKANPPAKLRFEARPRAQSVYLRVHSRPFSIGVGVLPSPPDSCPDNITRRYYREGGGRYGSVLLRAKMRFLMICSFEISFGWFLPNGIGKSRISG
jgi:hypothetical protein